MFSCWFLNFNSSFLHSFSYAVYVSLEHSISQFMSFLSSLCYFSVDLSYLFFTILTIVTYMFQWCRHFLSCVFRFVIKLKLFIPFFVLIFSQFFFRTMHLYNFLSISYFNVLSGRWCVIPRE